MKQWVADIIRQREVSAIPVMTHPGIEVNGHTVREAVSVDGTRKYLFAVGEQFVESVLMEYRYQGGLNLFCFSHILFYNVINNAIRVQSYKNPLLFPHYLSKK